MWAQLITMRVKEGTDKQVTRLLEHLRDIEQPDSGWVSTTALCDQADPQRVSILAVFESEEQARAREGDPRRAEGLATLRTMMGEILDGPLEFGDFVVIATSAP